MYEWFAIAYLVHHEKKADFNNIYNSSKNALVNQFNKQERRQRVVIFGLIAVQIFIFVYNKIMEI